MSNGLEVASLAVAVGTPFLVVSFGAVGFMLRRLIANSDAAAVARHDAMTERVERIERDQAGLGKRQDEAMMALNDLVREGFELAATDRQNIARDLGQRVARIEGHLGWPQLSRNGSEG